MAARCSSGAATDKRMPLIAAQAAISSAVPFSAVSRPAYSSLRLPSAPGWRGGTADRRWSGMPHGMWIRRPAGRCGARQRSRSAIAAVGTTLAEAAAITRCRTWSCVWLVSAASRSVPCTSAIRRSCGNAPMSAGEAPNARCCRCATAPPGGVIAADSPQVRPATYRQNCGPSAHLPGTVSSTGSPEGVAVLPARASMKAWAASGADGPMYRSCRSSTLPPGDPDGRSTPVTTGGVMVLVMAGLLDGGGEFLMEPGEPDAGSGGVFRAGLLVGVVVAVHLEEDQLPEGHARVDPHGPDHADLQRPLDGVPDMAQRSRHVDPDPERASVTVAVEQLGVTGRAGPFPGQAEIQVLRLQDHPGCRNAVFFAACNCGGIQDAPAYADLLTEPPVVGVRRQPAGLERVDHDVARYLSGPDRRRGGDQ